MAKMITNAMIMEALNGINSKLSSIEDRVSKLEKGAKAVPSKSGKGNATASAKAEKSAKFSTNLKDYEPKKDTDGEYNWYSLKAKRKDYCYAVATKGQALGCYIGKKKAFEFEDIAKDYDKAREQFDKKYPYKKKSDR